jgi:WD40 repeat protein
MRRTLVFGVILQAPAFSEAPMLNKMGRSRSSSGSVYHRILDVAVLVFGCLYSVQSPVGAADKDVNRTIGEPRKEGKWEVTPIGRAYGRLYYPHFADQHRLLLAIDSDPAQLWDTQTGKRVAILAGQKRGVDSCAISPDGTKLLTADRLGGWRYVRDEKNRKVSGWLWIWDLKTGKLLQKVEVDLSAERLRDSTDWEVEWLDRNKVHIQLDCRQNPARASVRTILGHLDLKMGKIVKWSKEIPGGESLYRSPDGKRALAGRGYGVWRQDDGEIAWGGRGTTTSVDLFDLVNLKVIAALDGRNLGEKDRSIVGRYWSKDSRWAATVGSDHTVGIWEGDSGKPVSTIKGHKDWILDVTFSPDGKTLVTASNDETAQLWNTASGKQVRVFEGHTAGLNTAVFDSKGARLLTGAEDETARLWDVATGKQIRAWGKHESAVRSVGFEKDDRTIWTRTVQGVRRLWKIEDGSLLSETRPTATRDDRFGVLYLKRTKGDGYEIWAGPPGVPGEGQREDGPPQLQPKFSMRGDSQFSAAVTSADGKTVASSGKNRTVCLWDLQRWNKVTGEGRTFLPAQPSDVWGLAFAPDGKALAVACDDGCLRLWDLAGRKVRLKFEGDALHVRSLVFSPDGTMLAGGSWERCLYLWKVATGKSMMRKVDATGPIHAVAFSPDGKTLASAGMVRDPDGKEENSFYKPGELILWDVASGKARQRLTGFRSAVACLACTPDGKTLIAGDFDKELSFWNVATGKRRAVVKGMTDTVEHLAISPDGKLLVSAHDFSDVVEFWDIGSAKEIGHFHSPARRGGSPAFTPDGRTLMISGSRVQFWDVGKLRESLLPPTATEDDEKRKK